ncbi:putative membrane protein [Cricetibacter osteomyelitidis]|uniref:Putative membrane protein n=1 Tax=Cricetibacter osteomyelitidis TaxID=1521931 RepID=A0A4R2T7I5_9PAST|nr:DMT family transporter [Cricetibacter osteomyelitidis]TCP96814.1 putative membrane protein [Cricetibacter osteomyelitidis]
MKKITQPQSYGKSVFYMIIAYASIALMGVFVKYASSTLPPNEVLFARFFVGFLFILPMIKKDARFSFKIRDKRYSAMRDGFGLLGMICMFYSLQYLPVSLSVLLMNTSALFVPLFAFLLFRNKISLLAVCCTLMGFVGVAITLSDITQDISLYYLLLGLFGAIFSALAFIALQKLNQTHSPLEIIFYFYFVSLLIIPMIFAYEWMIPNLTEFYYLVLVGITGLIFQIFLTKAFRFQNVAMVSPFIFTGVIFSSLCDWLVWRNSPTVNFWIGAVIIITSISLLGRLKRK